MISPTPVSGGVEPLNTVKIGEAYINANRHPTVPTTPRNRRVADTWVLIGGAITATANNASTVKVIAASSRSRTAFERTVSPTNGTSATVVMSAPSSSSAAPVRSDDAFPTIRHRRQLTKPATSASVADAVASTPSRAPRSIPRGLGSVVARFTTTAVTATSSATASVNCRPRAEVHDAGARRSCPR